MRLTIGLSPIRRYFEVPLKREVRIHDKAYVLTISICVL